MAARGGKMRSVKRLNRGADKETDDVEPCWDLLRMALVDIHTKNAGQLSFEQLYRASYKIVLRKQGETLYDRVRAFEEEWFQNHIMPNIAELISRNLISIKLVQMPAGSSANERRHMGEKFLRGVKDSWEDHNMSMNMVTDVLMYLDRTWAMDAKRPSIFAATIGLFRNKILRNSLKAVAMGPDGLDADEHVQIISMLNAVVLDLINMERDGDIIDRNLIRGIVSMLEDLYETDEERDSQRLYLTEFEPAFLEASRTFYKDECSSQLRNSDAGSWLRHSKRRLKEEQDRCMTTTSPLTQHRIASVVEEELIKAPLEEFLAMQGSGLRAMIDNDRVEDLTNLYELVSRVDPPKNALRKGLQTRVRELGFEIEKVLQDTDFSTATAGNGDEADGQKAKAQPLNAAAQQTAAAIRWVDDVMRLKDKFDNLWTTCFAEDVPLQSAVAKSFSEFINAFHRSSEYVSLFVDDMLKRGIKGKSPSEVDHMLDKAIVLVRYLTDRDMFERYYQKHLARRLLHARSENEDVERDMISRMKQAAGGDFTMKFEGMFKDMALSKDLSRDYKEHIRSLGDADTKLTELSVHVLTTNNWPHEVMGRSAVVEEAKHNTCIYPPAIKRLQESFFSFYLKDRSGRVLTWIPSAGSADMKCVFPRIEGKESGPLSRERRYELTVSTFGMVVLALFNDLAEDESLLFEEIRERTNIPTAELTRTLASLSLAAKARVLLKDPPTRAVRLGDRFAFNAQFVSKTVRIKAPTANAPSKVEDSEDRRDTERRNEQTRAHVVDAAIVRIMKSRRKLAHNDLIAHVIEQLVGRFKPEVALIKKRIEDLLGREYLERLDGDTAMYGYLA